MDNKSKDVQDLLEEEVDAPPEEVSDFLSLFTSNNLLTCSSCFDDGNQ